MKNVAENQIPVRVLLVEDSLPVRQRLRNLIEESGLVEILGEAGTVAGAVQLLAAHRLDAVILDLYLADGSGFSLVTEIKRACPTCVVIVLTSFAILETRERCLELGADYFFEKTRDCERVPEVLAELHRAMNKGKP